MGGNGKFIGAPSFSWNPSYTAGIGGYGSVSGHVPATDATVNTGSGGGGSGGNPSAGVSPSPRGAGAPGVVIVKAPRVATAITGTYTAAPDGSGLTYYKFTGPGTIKY
jgi:hypothetical protein